MLRLGMMVIALSMLGCGGSHTLDDDAGLDGGVDAFVTAPAIDSGRDAPTPVLDTPPMGVTLMNEERCEYRDYGSTCSVACDLPPDVPVFLAVEWTGPYCCNLDPANTHEGFWDCRCIDGQVLCPSSGLPPAPLRVPSSTCEFCPGTPSGMIPGSPSHDAGPDAFSSDAGT